MSQIRELLDQLNEEQIKPVLETEGAVLVLAGAGSGKTRVLTTRIAYLVEEKRVPPSAILSITFTNKAANEMKERVARVTDARDMWVCTIHSMCVRILRSFPEHAGIEKNFSIYSETERTNIVKQAYKEVYKDAETVDEKLLKTIKFHVANAKMLGLSPAEYEKEVQGEREADGIIEVYKKYCTHLKENNALDFDDLLNETRSLLVRNAEVREYLGGKFRYILVDEFQDTNGVQFDIIRLLASVHKNLFVVGDDDQSIYGWRGAKIENILHFEKSFPGSKTYKLERNYRSTKNILSVANEVIKNNGRRKQKTLWTENTDGEKPEVFESEEESGEARYVAMRISALLSRGYSYSDFAVLMRLNALTRSFEQEFASDGIPFKVFGGFKFYERKEIKDMLAYLRLVSNPFDSEALVRIVNFPKRGIGAKTVETLQDYATQTGLSVYDALLDLDELGFTGTTKQKLQTFLSSVKGWIIDGQSMPVNELVRKIVADTGMREAYGTNSDEDINKRANIDEFVNAVDEYCRLNGDATLEEYLSQVSLVSDTDDMNDGNYVTLATIHSVKGLEFKTVFVVGLEENVLPVSRAVEGNNEELEEERRLMYVAVTRAKQRLYITRSKSRYLYGRREPTMRSRFLNELSSVLDIPKDKPRYGSDGYGGDYYDDYPSERSERSRFGGGYGGTYGKTYGGSSYQSSSIKRSAWQGNTTTYQPSQPQRSVQPQRPAQSRTTASTFTFGGSEKAVQKPTTGGKDLSVFKIGVKVKHPKFGNGTIVGVGGVGANMILHIAFEQMGIKQISASLAPLTVIG